jgi:hypothetical protein
MTMHYPTQPETFAQPVLFELAPLVEPDYEHSSTLAERFAAFHEANPAVYDALRVLALRLRLLGVQKWSINGAFEVLRWQYVLQTRGDLYKLNNDFRAGYSRLLMEREPALAGFFEVRRSAADA